MEDVSPIVQMGDIPAIAMLVYQRVDEENLFDPGTGLTGCTGLDAPGKMQGRWPSTRRSIVQLLDGSPSRKEGAGDFW